MSVKHTIFQSKPARKNADQTNLGNLRTMRPCPAVDGLVPCLSVEVAPLHRACSTTIISPANDGKVFQKMGYRSDRTHAYDPCPRTLAFMGGGGSARLAFQGRYTGRAAPTVREGPAATYDLHTGNVIHRSWGTTGDNDHEIQTGDRRGTN